MGDPPRRGAGPVRMHELSIALSIVEVAAAHAVGRVRAVRLRLGPLSGVVKEALLGAYELAREGTALGDAELVIEEVPVTARCPGCAATRPVVSIQLLRCSACGAPTPEVVTGRELEVVALEVDP